jgi:predicted NBD/HSP70 family sugar kinase
MAKTIGVVISERVIAGLVVDHHLVGPLHSYPVGDDEDSSLVELHTEALVEAVCRQVIAVKGDHTDVTAVGIAVPGVIKNGTVEDAPNLPQLKGARIAELLSAELREHGLDCPVTVLNDADGTASGLAAAEGKLDRLLRVWTLGVGVGFGRYPFAEGVWEGGHTVVTLDEKENFCGCGGRGHIEGIMGHRAMRLRFLDMEPEEVFAEARNQASPDQPRCLDFVKLWHRALAAGMATSIHQDGPGKFFVTGFNARFVDMTMLKECVARMVKLSPLQSWQVEIVGDNAEMRIIGSAVAAEQAAQARC